MSQLLLACMFGCFVCPQPGLDAATSYQKHIRVTNERILEVLQYACARSPTFRGLLSFIVDADRIVYIDEGSCHHQAFSSCLQVASGVPFLFIRVDARATRLSVVRQLAHELQHAAEIAVQHIEVSTATIDALYRRIGYASCAGGGACYETRAGQDVEARVRREADGPAPTPHLNPLQFGSWHLDLQRSSLADCAPARAQRIDRDRGHGLMSTVIDAVDCAGIAHRDAFVFKIDGRAYPIASPGRRSARTIALTPVDELTVMFVVKGDGIVRQCGRRHISGDGAVLTIETSTEHESGRAQRTTEVWTRTS